MKLTHEKLLEILHYNPETGNFTWLVDRRQNMQGKIAGSINTHYKTGKRYVLITTHGKKWRAHRLAWFYVHGELPKGQIDHINGDGTDNRIVNLRVVDARTNARNHRKSISNKSGVTGVVWFNRESKWCAQIRVDYKNIRFGLFVDFNEAVKARREAEVFYGFHPNHGKERPL